MSAVLPPSGGTAPTSTGTAVPVQLTVSGDAAKALTTLPAGTMIDALAQVRAAKGVLEVMTLDGPLTLKVQPPATLPPIPEGTRLSLQVGPNGGLTLMGLNGRALGGGPVMGQGVLAGLTLPPILTGGAGPGNSAPNGLAPGLTPQGAPTSALAGTDGAIKAAPALGLTATVIRPAQTPQPNAIPATDQALSPALPPGTQITVRIAGIEPPAMTVPPTVPSLPATPLPPGQIASVPLPAPGPAALPGQSQNLPGQPGISLAPSPPSGAGHSLTGTVSAHPPGGQAVLSTPIGAVALPSAESLPVGSMVKLDVIGPPQLPNTAPPSPTRPDGLTAQGWPALSDTLDSLSNPADRQALDALMRVIPQSGPRLAAAMVAFGGLMRSGDARGALTDGIGKALDRSGKRELAERLKADLADLADDQGRVVGNGDWRLHTMPFAHGGQVDPIHLFVRAPSGDDQRRQAGTRDGDQRFILDFNLSNLGRLQMDGLVRREDKLFDLIIRTDQPLAQPIRMDIMAIFTQAAELVGTKGSVAFQSGGRWVDIPTHPTGPTSIQA